MTSSPISPRFVQVVNSCSSRQYCLSVYLISGVRQDADEWSFQLLPFCTYARPVPLETFPPPCEENREQRRVVVECSSAHDACVLEFIHDKAFCGCPWSFFALASYLSCGTCAVPILSLIVFQRLRSMSRTSSPRFLCSTLLLHSP